MAQDFLYRVAFLSMESWVLCDPFLTPMLGEMDRRVKEEIGIILGTNFSEGETFVFVSLQASLLACEGLSGVCLVPTVASKKMMPKQSSKQVENGERGGAPDMLGHRKESEKSRNRKEEETTEGSPPKKNLKKADALIQHYMHQLQVVVIEQNGSFQLRIPKNFICEHCLGAFRSSYHLKRHILIHTGLPAPAACDLFCLSFSRTDRLLRHKRMCQGCPSKGSDSQLLL
ncbi:hypothetical protein JD844_010791 [Phrynosoma platyrhinos]|uniref:C2H2-type domain-containing protein n=1 Tax=Phrynosoma platyrhinos TaxID=52577 RepID=A0ABQ7TGZ7_PHRPL|nr:hypothetical protein JD844_010791 [Phrynosoma platyrhinos]